MTTKTDPTKYLPLSETAVALSSPWLWGVPLFSALALALLLLLGDNVALFYFMNRIMTSASDGLWIHLSLLGDGLLVIMFVLPFLGRRPDVVWQYLLAMLLGGIFVHGLKALFSTLRPPGALSLDSFHLIGPALQNNAFPSGHTTAIFVLAGLVCLQRLDAWGKLGDWIKSGTLLLAILVGFSRIASGVHWPVDVLGAATGGWIVAILAVWLGNYWRSGLNIWAQRMFAVIVTPFSVWAVWSLWHDLDQVYPGTGLMKVLLLASCLGLSVPGQLRLFNLRK
ncbi:MAG TPA: phosphatase PAP2 family protein [Gallionellaceae bacterium]|nr:phosphatase PAP2 family protein [Gallionellaceae bacterium]